MENMKKDFQKVCKMYRDTLPDVPVYYSCGVGKKMERPKYPKAIMTAQQVRKGTATVNCDLGEGAKKTAEAFSKYPPFIEWCESYGIKTVKVEAARNTFGLTQYQVRVTF